MTPEAPTTVYAMSMSATAKSKATGTRKSQGMSMKKDASMISWHPTYEIPFSSLADDSEYIQATPATGIPMGQMAGSDDYENVNMDSKNRIPFNHLAGNGEYLHTAPVAEIPMGQTNNNGDYVNVNMEPKGRNVRECLMENTGTQKTRIFCIDIYAC